MRAPYLVVVAIVLSCGTAQTDHGQTNPPTVIPDQRPAPIQDSADAGVPLAPVVADCPRRVKRVMVSTTPRKSDAKSDARIKCAGDPPEIHEVETTTCAPGMLCVDAKNQMLWLKNIAAYEKWVRDVMACEAHMGKPDARLQKWKTLVDEYERDALRYRQAMAIHESKKDEKSNER